MADNEQARQEVFRRFEVWGWQSAPARKYALLVAGYFRSRGPIFVEGEEKYLRFFGDDGRALLELVEASADRTLTARERSDALRLATAADEVSWVKTSRHATPYNNPGAGHLRHALDDPHQATRQLLTDACGSLPAIKFSWPDILRVMECLRPAAGGQAVAWTPPAEAVAWARRMYEGRNFADLRALADMLEAAGCPDRPLLDHCRNHPEHFRGCAALDWLLGAGGVTPDQTDPLTGLANRGAFKLAVAEAAHRAGATGSPVSVLAFDLDGFSRLNRNYGMIVGDRVLTELAGFMRACLDGHLLARTGGDRFGVLLPGHDLPAALLVAERLRQAVEGWRWDAPDYGISGVSLTVTIGAAALGHGITSADDLFRAGNEAFYRAEAAGSNRVSE